MNELLKKYGQEHLEGCVVKEIDIPFLIKTFEDRNNKGSADSFSPIEIMDITEDEKQKNHFAEIGLASIKKNENALLLLAGGQGTRLGVKTSKGMVNIGITAPHYIFQFAFERAKKTAEEAGAFFEFFVMTSDINNKEIREFLKEKNYFGYPEDKVHFFVQGLLPAISEDGKLLLSDKGMLALSPDGNGNWYSALRKSGFDSILSSIKNIFLIGLDNVSQIPMDPAFLGAFIESGFSSATKVVPKAYPDEKVGIICKRNGKPSIVEYYEMSEKMRNEKDENGNLSYRGAIILNYIFKISELEKIISSPLPLHLAHKKIPYINEEGESVTPTEPNGYKFETLTVDLVEKMGTCLPYMAKREEEFSPIKNKEGTDSVETARAILQNNGVEL